MNGLDSRVHENDNSQTVRGMRLTERNNGGILWGMEKKVVILGSTGSIGKNALKVIDALNEHQRGGGFKVEAISAHNNVELLAKQAAKYKPRIVAIANKEKYAQLKGLIGDSKIEILTGAESLVEIAELEGAEIVVSAVVGSAGLQAVLAAAKKGKRLAIANKEPLVIAGKLLTRTARENNALLIPVDSEHSAIFQAMQAGRREEVARIILTSSGGPFRKMGAEELENVTVKQALAHPVWDMGKKITIDSATMMNKALEVIEARWLFDMTVEKIEVLIHPESIIHSLVEFVDGSVISQMGLPDMCLPIQYALTYPVRVGGAAKRLELERIGKLSFEKPDLKTFRALALGFEVAKLGGTAAAVFNAANEAAVEQFLAGNIRFTNIVELIEGCLSKHTYKEEAGLDELMESDSRAREQVRGAVGQAAFR